MRRLILINIVASIVITSYFYLFTSKEQRDSFFSKSPIGQALDPTKMKKAFNENEREKEARLTQATKEFNSYLGRSKLQISSFEVERKSNVKQGQLVATNTLSFTLDAKPNYISDIENETRRLMKEWVSIYQHDTNEFTSFKMLFQGQKLYQLSSKRP